MKKQTRVAVFDNCRSCDNAMKPFGHGLSKFADWRHFIWCAELGILVNTRFGEYPNLTDLPIPSNCMLEDA